MFEQTFGHKNVKAILEKQLISGSIPHAYLFVGPDGVGKKTLALEFAKQVLKTEKLENHADFQILDQGYEEITAEALKSFISNISFKPFLSEKKVAIINNAENLNPQSSNALLKTLEEPSSSAVIILVAGKQKVLPTIFSRCQTLRFSSFSKRELKAFADSGKFHATEQVLALSYGKISRLSSLLTDEGYFKQEQAVVNAYDAFTNMDVGEKLMLVGKYAEKENEELSQNFQSWVNCQLNRLASEPKNFTKLSAISEALDGLDANLNKKMVLQSLFLKI